MDNYINPNSNLNQDPNQNTYPNNNDEIELLIKVQTKLAKNHGIFGFAIYFDLSKLNYYKNIINFFSNKAIIMEK